MKCLPCQIGQFALNVILTADRTANMLLGGSPNETMSRRAARAREAGKKWARVVCRVLTAIFFWRRRDHCAYALQPGSIGREILPLSNNYTEPKL